MGHEEVVLQGFPVEAERLPAPAALRARLARLAGLAVPPTRPRRLEEPEHLSRVGSFIFTSLVMARIDEIFGRL